MRIRNRALRYSLHRLNFFRGICVMNKFICVALLAIFFSACTYNPVQYEKQRQFENEQHNRLMG